MSTPSILVVGAGAAGITAAIAAARRGASVTLCEKTPRIGRKILASGNGRCNLSNDDLSETHYNAASRRLVHAVLSGFGSSQIASFFTEIGLRMRSDGGRVFPSTNQASSVLRVLELEMQRLRIRILRGCDVTSVARTGRAFSVTARSGGRFEPDRVIITGGGKSYPALGSDGSTYALARSIGHAVIEPVPVCVPLIVKDRLCHQLQGQKIHACVTVRAAGSAHRASGDLLFTAYGLSGTAVLDISRDVSIALNRTGARSIELTVDMVPFMTRAELAADLAGRCSRALPAQDILAGILPNKFAQAFAHLFGARDPDAAARALKESAFTVHGTRGWNEAEFTAGGVDTSEIDSRTLESKPAKGVYFAGEVLDVDGERGGYNLAWAWASGYRAGEAAAHA